MSKLFSKLGMGEKTARNFITILLIAAGGAIIYGLPYFRYDYYDAYLEVYHLTNTQMGVFGSIFGVFGMISYLFGGYLADRVSIRLLLTVSLVGTGPSPCWWACMPFGASPPCLRSGPPV